MMQEQLVEYLVRLLLNSPDGDVPCGSVGFPADALVDFAIMEEGRRDGDLCHFEPEYIVFCAPLADGQCVCLAHLGDRL